MPSPREVWGTTAYSVRQVAVGVLVLFIVDASNGVGQQPPGKDTRVPPVPVILQGYLANLESFAYLSCRFKVMETKADSMENALKGQYSAPEVVHEGIWLVNGKKERYEVICNPEVAKQIRAEMKEGAKGTMIPVVVDSYLTDGKYKIRAVNLIGIANFYTPARYLKPPRNQFFCTITFPLDYRLEQVIANPGAATVNGMVQKDGRDLVSVSFLPDDPERQKETAFFDLNQGYLPIADFREDEKSPKARYIQSVMRLPGDRWFPEKVVYMDRPERKAVRVIRAEVTSLDITNPPSDAEFDMDLADFFQVLDHDRPGSVFSPRPGEKIEVAKMSLIDERLERQAKGRPEAPSTVEGVPEDRSWSISRIILITASLVLIVLGVLIALRYRRNRRSSGDPTV